MTLNGTIIYKSGIFQHVWWHRRVYLFLYFYTIISAGEIRKNLQAEAKTTHAQWVCRCDVRWNQPIISRRILIMFFKGLKPRVYEGI